MSAIVKRVRTDPRKRRIFISDIHGNLALLERLLGDIRYCEDDELYLLGDYIERGEQSLATLRAVAKLCEGGRVHAISGNWDCLWQDVRPEGKFHDDLVRFALRRPNSLFRDMAGEIGFPLAPDTPTKAFSAALRASFSAEFAFLSDLAHIIETDEFVLAHAGLDSLELEKQDPERVMKRDAFLRTAPRFTKNVIVGHFPVQNYCDGVCSCNPVFDFQKRVISIDGGNAVKLEGQLNALILRDGEFSFHGVDALPTASVRHGQKAGARPLTINWESRFVELLERRERDSLCRHIASGRILSIEQEFLFCQQGRLCAEYTDYALELEPGDQVSVARRMDGRTLVKRGGVIGWANNDCIDWDSLSPNR
ncbi:MAG: metallophosphoesterase [Bacillota bacterium]